MSKIKNRFTKKAIITVHDNLLSDLFRLNLERGATYNVINDEEYLVNKVSGRGYQIGLRVLIPSDLLTIDGVQRKYEELLVSEQEEIFDMLKDKLYFSNAEMLITNILLDKYLNSNGNFEISFKEVESHYRKKAISHRNITLNNFTYQRYISVINSLADKEIFLKTNGNFRNVKYGVNNKVITQPFLSISNTYHYGKNNEVFSYSFGNFGIVLKLSRRYSNNLISANYRFSFNQVIKHSMAYYLGQQIFIARNNLNKHPFASSYKTFQLNIQDILGSVNYESRSRDIMGLSIASKLDGYKNQPNKNRTYRMVIGYIEELLKGFCSNNSIYNYEVKYSYDETESFNAKHEFDYDIDNVLNYMFTTKDISQDVSVAITVYLENPNEIDKIHYTK